MPFRTEIGRLNLTCIRNLKPAPVLWSRLRWSYPHTPQKGQPVSLGNDPLPRAIGPIASPSGGVFVWALLIRCLGMGDDLDLGEHGLIKLGRDATTSDRNSGLP